MLLLAVDCSFGGHSLALLRDSQLLSTEHHPRTHATEGLPLSLTKLGRRTGIELAQLDLLAFGAGPGRFSGIRSACATVQGLGYGLDLQVVPVATTQALALQANKERSLIAYPAHRDHCYLATHERAANGSEQVVGPRLYRLDQLPSFAGDWSLCGRKLARLKPALRRACTGQLSCVPGPIGSLAPAVGQLAFRHLEWAVPPSQAQALYVRNKVAYTAAETLAMHAAWR